jgi:hypothetical protein
MKHMGIFPFGEPLMPVVQKDRSPKKIFVLGVYASAVHARWINSQGKEVVKALAVASEPYIFWRGDKADAEEVIAKINHRLSGKHLGELEPANARFNGPSGITLDEKILEQLGIYQRSDAWLCDLVPHSCMNDQQKRAIENRYTRLVGAQFGEPSIPPPVLSDLVKDDRVNGILGEFQESKAEMLILLGDQPIKWFLRRFTDKWYRLSDFGIDPGKYGILHTVHIKEKQVQVLPLAHPRQIEQLGKSSSHWFECHQTWMKDQAPKLRREI